MCANVCVQLDKRESPAFVASIEQNTESNTTEIFVQFLVALRSANIELGSWERD